MGCFLAACEDLLMRRLETLARILKETGADKEAIRQAVVALVGAEAAV